MKKTITCILLTAGLTGYLSAQTPVQDKSDKNSGKVIRMDKQMFLDNIFDYTSGSTNWKYKGEKPAVIDFYATWCGPCRMVAPLLKSLAKEWLSGNFWLVSFKISYLCLPLFYETRTTPSCHPSGCAYRQL